LCANAENNVQSAASTPCNLPLAQTLHKSVACTNFAKICCLHKLCTNLLLAQTLHKSVACTLNNSTTTTTTLAALAMKSMRESERKVIL